MWARLETPVGRAAIWTIVVLAFVFLYAPMLVVAGAAFGGGSRASIEFPPSNLSFARFLAIPASQYRAVLLSVELAAIAAAAGVVIGVPASLGLVRGNFPGKTFVAMIFRAPLQIPAVVLGITLLQLSYAAGDALGLDIAGSFTALAVAHCFIAIPYVIGTVTAILQRFDRRLEEAAFSLGASPWRTFRRVTLPVIMPGLYAGALYAFMISFSDVPISIFLAAPGSATYPVEIFAGLEHDFDPSILASATLVTVFCFALMLAVQRLVGMETLLRTGGAGGR